MAPRVRVLAGTSPSTMAPITSLVNTSTPYKLSSDLFEGEIVAHIKGLTDENGEIRDSEYFKREDRRGVTWSIQVQGRFLVPHSADDILFGNTFDRPLKLPWGTSAVLKFMHYIDPTLEHDLMLSTKPWALSPLISTMPYFAHTRLPSYVLPPSSSASHLLVPPGHIPSLDTTLHPAETAAANAHMPPFPPAQSIQNSTGQLYLAVVDDAPSSPSSASSSTSSSGSGVHSPASSASSLSSGLSHKSNKADALSSESGGGSQRIKQAMKKVAKRRRSLSRVEQEMRHFESGAQRRAYFANTAKRRAVQFGPEDLITTDFCYGFINFAPSLSLQLPGGLSFDLMRYWDGQPVRFVCCERKDPNEMGDDPWGRIFWCVAIEMVDDQDSEE